MKSSTNRQFKRRQDIYKNQQNTNNLFTQTFQEQHNNQVSINADKTPIINQNDLNPSNMLQNKTRKTTCSEKQIIYRNQQLACKFCGKSLRRDRLARHIKHVHKNIFEDVVIEIPTTEILNSNPKSAKKTTKNEDSKLTKILKTNQPTITSPTTDSKSTKTSNINHSTTILPKTTKNTDSKKTQNSKTKSSNTINNMPTILSDPTFTDEVKKKSKFQEKEKEKTNKKQNEKNNKKTDKNEEELFLIEEIVGTLPKNAKSHQETIKYRVVFSKCHNSGYNRFFIT